MPEKINYCGPEFTPFFDQEPPEVFLLGLIASMDKSEPYKLDAGAVFKAKKGYLVVFVSGCSCWPGRGMTNQIHCHTKADVDKHLTGEWTELLDKCQVAKWKVIGYKKTA